MTQSKHTPGPWSLPHFARPEVNCECGYVLTDGYMGAVAKVFCSGEGENWIKHGDNPKFDEAVANAKLIAAAPDLFAAGTALMAELEKLVGSYEFGTDKTIQAFRAALAKAHGDAQ